MDIFNLFKRDLPNKDILVCCHIYYFGIWKDDIEKRLKAFSETVPFDLFVTITDNEDRTYQIKDIKANFPNAEVQLIPNLGEDARGFAACAEWLRKTQRPYKQILKIHTKSELGWRTDLLNSLMRTDEDFLTNLMSEDCGFAASEKYYRYSPNNNAWNFNGQWLDEEREMTGCEYRTTNHFSGTMFWISFDVMKKYFIDSEKFVQDYFDQPYAIGYTKQHSFELLIGCIAHDCGKKLLTVEDGFLSRFRDSLKNDPNWKKVKLDNPYLGL